jgi:peptidoglycan/xylan/chitin deacetylase (PgdA/CDA1 family)
MRDLLGTLLPRCVSWMFDSALWRLPREPGVERRLCLTFDDGPTPSGTLDLLRVLSRHGVPATFFLIGTKAVRSPELVRAILSDGHTIGNHTWTHRDAWTLPVRRMQRELCRATQALEDMTGTAIRWMRPPYGHFTLPMIAWCRRRQQRMVMWDSVLPDYRPGVTAGELGRHLRRYLRPDAIVCLHDNAHSRAATPALLHHALPQLIADGWQFTPLKPEWAWRQAADSQAEQIAN